MLTHPTLTSCLAVTKPSTTSVRLHPMKMKFLTTLKCPYGVFNMLQNVLWARYRIVAEHVELQRTNDSRTNTDSHSRVNMSHTEGTNFINWRCDATVKGRGIRGGAWCSYTSIFCKLSLLSKWSLTLEFWFCFRSNFCKFANWEWWAFTYYQRIWKSESQLLCVVAFFQSSVLKISDRKQTDFATKLILNPDAVPSIYPGYTASMSQRVGKFIFLVFYLLTVSKQIRSVLDHVSKP